MKPGSGTEGRIYAQYKELRKRWDYSGDGKSRLYLRLARQWQMPCWEIERIIKEGKSLHT